MKYSYSYVSFFLSHFIMKNFKHIVKWKEFYSEHLYVHHLDSTMTILLSLFHFISIYLSIQPMIHFISEQITDITTLPRNTVHVTRVQYLFTFFLRGEIYLQQNTQVSSMHLLSFDKPIHLGNRNNYQDTEQYHHPETSLVSLSRPSPPSSTSQANFVLMFFCPKLVLFV